MVSIFFVQFPHIFRSVFAFFTNFKNLNFKKRKQINLKVFEKRGDGSKKNEETYQKYWESPQKYWEILRKYLIKIKRKWIHNFGKLIKKEETPQNLNLKGFPKNFKKSRKCIKT